MTLILHFHESGWWVHYQELGLSIPLPFSDFYKALDHLQRRYPDAQLAVTQPPLGESQIDCVVAARRGAVLDYITSHFCDLNLSGSS
jgi:hypothetical protein